MKKELKFMRLRATLAIIILIVLFWLPFVFAIKKSFDIIKSYISDEYFLWSETLKTAMKAFISGEQQ